MTDRFSDLLPVEPLGGDRFIVRPPGDGFLFGGLTLAMVLRCAAETVEDGKVPLSLHGTFLASGEWGGPHEVAVQRVSDTRAFAVRRIEMSTGGRLALSAEAVFHQPEAGEDWHAAAPPAAPEPQSLEPFHFGLPFRMVDFRPLQPANTTSARPERLHPYWCRLIEPLSDPILIACALAFVSDYWVYGTPFPAGSGASQGLLSRTWSQTLMFHRPAQGDDWWYVDCDPLTVAAGRFLSRGLIQAPDGALLASFIQQGVIRPLR